MLVPGPAFRLHSQLMKAIRLASLRAHQSPTSLSASESPRLFGSLSFSLFLIMCGGEPPPVAPMPLPPMPTATQTATAVTLKEPPSRTSHPLLSPWVGPYGGVPPFKSAKASDLEDAIMGGIETQLDLVGRIEKNPESPTFENTIVALERAGLALDRVQAIYGVFTSTLSDETVQKVERTVEPPLAALDDKIYQNPTLFARIAAVYADSAKLTPEQKRVTWLYYTSFVRAGAKLSEADRTKVFDLNQKLSKLYTQFSQNVLAEEGSQFVALEKDEDFAGLPDSLKDSAKAAATARGMAGKGLISNTRSSVDPFLAYSSRRDLREKVWRMFTMRGDNGGAQDNNALIHEILTLRNERAKLLGYATHAHYRLELSMAKTPERATELMEAVWKPAVARVREEVADMQRIADTEARASKSKLPKIKIEAWDYRYYAEKVRKAKYDLDQNDVKPYLSLESLREGMFWVAGELYGFRFAEIKDGSVSVYHPDVRVFEVTRENAHVGYWFFDPYARKGKRSGAWMNAYRPQSRMDGVVPTIVSNNSNFVKAAPGAPVLISWDDARTLFHEFGHAIHGLSSNVTYPRVGGTAVARDYVEFPSQVMERWLSTPEVLNKFALHHETKKPIPAELVKKIEKSATFNEGFTTVEYLASALVDMRMHMHQGPIDAKQFEKDTLSALGMPSEIVMRHRAPHFNHVFSGEGYSAGYYSYLWADTLAADGYEAFREAKGPYDKDVAKRFFDRILSVGNSIDPAEGYRAFRGRDAGIEALMRHRGFAVKNAVKPQVAGAPKGKPAPIKR
jgi:peptidyl-dipeptidase Dcp